MRKDVQIYNVKTKKKENIRIYNIKKKTTYLETFTNLQGKIKLKTHFQQKLSILNKIPSSSIYLTHIFIECHLYRW